MRFSIVGVEGKGEAASRNEYRSLEDARVALREALGWENVWLAPGYTTPDSARQIWRAFRTREELSSDADEADGPRIVRAAPDASETT